jgi:hypothetical protein
MLAGFGRRPGITGRIPGEFRESALMGNERLLRTLQAMRDATEDHLKQLDEGGLRLVRVAAGGNDLDVTVQQMAVLASQLNELNLVLAYLSQPLDAEILRSA